MWENTRNEHIHAKKTKKTIGDPNYSGGECITFKKYMDDGTSKSMDINEPGGRGGMGGVHNFNCLLIFRLI